MALVLVDMGKWLVIALHFGYCSSTEDKRGLQILQSRTTLNTLKDSVCTKVLFDFFSPNVNKEPAGENCHFTSAKSRSV